MKADFLNYFAPENRAETLAGLFFVLPVIIGFLLFVAGPMLATIFLSFQYYDILSPATYAGLDHFVWLWEDRRFWKVLNNTFFFTFWAVLGNTGLGVILAVLLNKNMPKVMLYVYRTAYFFPTLVGLVFVAVIWQFLFQRDIGIINYYLGQIGIDAVGWLSDPDLALISVIILDVWKNVGIGMLIAMAGLQGISAEYYDAAKIDGAGPLRTFWSVTLPLLSPTILFLLTINTIGALRIFESIIVLTNGGPGDASRSIVMYIYEAGFKSLEMGYASAVSLVLLGLIVLVTALNFFLSRWWTFYE